MKNRFDRVGNGRGNHEKEYSIISKAVFIDYCIYYLFAHDVHVFPMG